MKNRFSNHFIRGFKPLLFLCCLTLLFIHTGHGQCVINKETQVSGQIVLSEDISVPAINSGYTLWLPQSGVADGLIVFFHSRRDTVNTDAIIEYATQKNLGVAYVTTTNRFDFFFTNVRLGEVHNYLSEIITENSIPPDNLFYCGMSLAGTRALKLAIWQKQQKDVNITPKAIAICDAPLDMTRFYKELVKAKQRKIHPAASNEGAWVSAYLEKNLGGTPKDSPINYVNYSPYTYSADGGPNLDKLRDIYIRAYTEPDVTWWMESRGKDYYGMNAIDLAAMINDLNYSGSEKASLIVTENKGYHPNGDRHPHSWSIVDESELADWFLTLMKEE